jgi:hypothetical protein
MVDHSSYNHRFPLGLATIDALFYHHHHTLESVIVNEASTPNWIRVITQYTLSDLKYFDCETVNSMEIPDSTKDPLLADMLEKLHCLRIGDNNTNAPRTNHTAQHPALHLEKLNAAFDELISFGKKPLLQSLEMVRIGVDVPVIPSILVNLRRLAFSFCAGADQFFGVLSSAAPQIPGIWPASQLKEILYVGTGRRRPNLAAFKDFVCSFSGLEMLVVQYESPCMSSGSNRVLKPIIKAHRATLKVLVWRLRPRDASGHRNEEQTAMQDVHLKSILKGCQS